MAIVVTIWRGSQTARTRGCRSNTKVLNLPPYGKGTAQGLAGLGAEAAKEISSWRISSHGIVSRYYLCERYWFITTSEDHSTCVHCTS